MTLVLEIALKSFLVFGVAALATLLLGRAAASTRHLVWTLAVVTVLLLPAAVVLGPRQPLAVGEDSVLAPLAGDAAAAASLRSAVARASRLILTEETRTGRESPLVAAGREPDAAASGSTPAAGTGSTVLLGGLGDGRAAAGPPTVGHMASSGDNGPSPGELDGESGATGSSPIGELRQATGAAGARGRLGRDAAVAASGAGRWAPAARISGGTLVLAAWLSGAALVVLVLLLERVRVGFLARSARPCTRGPIADAFARVCAGAGLRRLPRLRIGKPGAMPMTWGTAWPVVLLPAEAERWLPSRLHAVLHHEVEHVRRRDDLTQIVATLAAALHWFDPLAWLAVRRLRVERELACDDAVLRLGARPSGYAQELLCIADEFRNPAATGLAAQSMARRSQLHHRLRAVLEESRNRHAITTGRALAGGLSAAILAAPLATLALVAAPAAAGATTPTPQATGATTPTSPAAGATTPPSPATGAFSSTFPAAQGSECWRPGVDRSSRSTTDTDDNLRILEWESDGCRADLRLRGDLVFNDDFTEVVGISPGGSFLLEHEEDGTLRRLELEAGPGGAPQWTWLVEGRVQPFDAEARRWFSGILVSVLRASGIAAEERAAWIYDQRGAEGVFDEVSMMYSNSTKARYLQALLRQDGLSDDDLGGVVERVREGIDSNSAKGRVLETLGSRYPDRIVGGALETAFWQAVASIDSNSTTMRLLVALVEGQPQDAPIVGRAMRSAAANIDSNSTMANFLRRLQDQYPTIASSGSQATLFWEAVAQIDSNSTMRGFLLDIGEGTPVEDTELLPLIFDMAQESISSNSTLAEFIRTMDRRYPGIGESGPMRDEFWETVDRIDSSSTLSSLLLDLAAGKPDDAPMLDVVLDAGARRIDSSSQRSRFLVSFATAHPGAARGRLADELLEAARGIDSRSNRERALRSLQDLGIGQVP